MTTYATLNTEGKTLAHPKAPTAKPTTGKTVDQLIATAIAASAKSDQAIQDAAVAVLIHAEKHGDYTKANTLVFGLGKGARVTSLAAWFAKFGGLLTEDDLATTKTGEGFVDWVGADFIRTNFTAAKAEMWYMTKKAPDPFKGFDLKAHLTTQLKAARKAIAKVGDSPELAGLVKAPDEALTALQAIIDSL